MKKFLFGILFLLSFAAFHFFFSDRFQTYDWVFGMGTDVLGFMFAVSFLVLLSALFFIIFAALSQDLKIGAPVIVLGTLTPLAFLPNALGLVLAGGYLISLLLFYLLVVKNITTYITFSPTPLLSHPVRTLATLLVLVISIGFYFSINSVLKKDGFKVPETILPDAIIEQVIRSQQSSVLGARYVAQNPTITSEQLQLLKQNPELLKQYGITTEMVEKFEKTLPEEPAKKSNGSGVPNLNPTNLVKGLVFDQINDIANQYLYIVAPILALMVWSLFAFANFFLFLLVNPLLWGIFWVLEKTNFIHFEKEMREVKKLVV